MKCPCCSYTFKLKELKTNKISLPAQIKLELELTRLNYSAVELAEMLNFSHGYVYAMLIKMHKKGIIKRKRINNLYYYHT